MVPVVLGRASGGGGQVSGAEIAGLYLSFVALVMTNFCSVSLWAVFECLITFYYFAYILVQLKHWYLILSCPWRFVICRRSVDGVEMAVCKCCIRRLA